MSLPTFNFLISNICSGSIACTVILLKFCSLVLRCKNLQKVWFFYFIGSIDGNWGQWRSARCSVTCGQGLRNITRDCDSPAPVGTGHNCVGPHQLTENCYFDPCKTFFHFSLFHFFSLSFTNQLLYPALLGIFCITNTQI